MTVKLFLTVGCVFLLAACGHSSPGPAPTTSPRIALPSASAPTTAPVVTVGCGTYCQQAGVAAGNAPPGYPCSTAGCLQCPPENCVTVESSAGTATNGVVTVKLRCNLSTECHGAFLLCTPAALCEDPPGAVSDGGRLAGSDFVAAPGTTANVGVALTGLGKAAVSQRGSLRVKVLVDLLNYGTVLGQSTITGDFTLTSTDPPFIPAGATASCGGLVFVGPNTSCPFAKNVEKAYYATANFSNAKVTAFSPVTGQTYKMHCTVSSAIVCKGGTNALVEFYDYHVG